MDWLRLYTEITWDRKLRRHSMATRWIWISVMVMARRSPIPGTLLLSDGVPVTEADIEDEAAATMKEVKQALAIFVEQKMLAQDDTGTYYIVHWEQRQPNSDSSAERTRKYREGLKRKRDVAERNAVTKSKTSQDRHSDVTELSQKRPGDVLETETETETEYVVTACAREAALKEISAAIQQVRPVTKAAEHCLIADMVDNYPRDWILQAIEVAVTRKGRSFSYIDGILANWRKAGFADTDKPWEDVKRNEHRYNGRDRPGKASPGTIPSQVDWENEPDHL